MGTHLGRGGSRSQVCKGPGLALGSSVGCRGLTLSWFPLTLAPNPPSSSLNPAQWWGCPAQGPPRKSCASWKVRARVQMPGPRPTRSTITPAQVGGHPTHHGPEGPLPLGSAPTAMVPQGGRRMFPGQQPCGLLARSRALRPAEFPPHCFALGPDSRVSRRPPPGQPREGSPGRAAGRRPGPSAPGQHLHLPCDRPAGIQHLC